MEFSKSIEEVIPPPSIRPTWLSLVTKYLEFSQHSLTDLLDFYPHLDQVPGSQISIHLFQLGIKIMCIIQSRMLFSFGGGGR